MCLYIYYLEIFSLNIMYAFNYCNRFILEIKNINVVNELYEVVVYAIMGLFRSLLFKRNEQPRGNEGRQHYVKG